LGSVRVRGDGKLKLSISRIAEEKHVLRDEWGGRTMEKNRRCPQVCPDVAEVGFIWREKR